ncbi:Cytochrome P450 [Mycena indigotica]|uniref:Cytochrome P450 n=1 Tax=Mycena indigotica TaxID=2126181 RepID=A0A8H6W2T2_9AGAR|nr:Cytochrome P450 [Mycena indigotica]KAF7303509.1 Cytochrome P450 [Mycena indigotica]
MDSVDLQTPLLVALVLSGAFLLSRSRLREWEKDKRTPAVASASSDPLSYYVAVYRFLRGARSMVANAYAKDPTGVFRFARPFRWEYVANGAHRVLEAAGVPEEILSFQAAAGESLQIEWTMGKPIQDDPWHVSAVRTSLTRNLSRCFPEVRDEIVHAFQDVLALRTTGEWETVTVLPTMMKVVSRTSNRLFVGLPLCRNPEYINLSIDYTVSVFSRGSIIALFPDFMKRFVSPILSSKNSSLRYALKFLGPILEERIDAEKRYGKDRPDRPNDLISWLLDYAPEHELTPPALTLRILAINMAAIHTSSTTLASALFDLAAHPEHIDAMREEAEQVIEAEGWSKAALNNMHKIDSFLRESQRLSGTGAVAMSRKVVAPDGFTFSDGTTIPHGAFLSFAGLSSHTDPAHYENSSEFDGFRFSRMREEGPVNGNGKRRGVIDNDDDDTSPKVFNRQMVATTPEHIVFGHGRHACPGRFFAATELKAMLAHILIEYDIEALVPGEAGRPKDLEFGVLRMPSSTGAMRIRKRMID